MFIINNYVSHIFIQVIQYCVNKKIILLCFLTYIIYILQLLNIKIFDSLSTIYKNKFHKITQ